MPYRDSAARVYCAPLLPFERLLIQELGFSEDEYRWYKSEIARRGGVRPAEYDHIPDVQNLPAWAVSALISLAIGAVTTAVSFLLAPTAPEAPEQARSKRLQSVNGRQRFNQTFGFEGGAELAQYGTPIPILFGRYTERPTHTTGGIMAAPSLVWSRMFSYGSNQGYKGLYLVGESTLSAPDVAGIFIGTMPVDSVPGQQYAFYWSSKNGDNRVKAADLFAGTRAEQASGDPETHDDIFQCPTLTQAVDTGFCSVYTPTGNTEFGAYDPIFNGTFYKVNWQIISIPEGRDEDRRLRATRRKIAGGQANKLDQGMPGTGAGYTCGMGLVKHNDSTVSLPARVRVNVNDTVVFRIASKDFFDRDFDKNNFAKESGVTADDISQRTITNREQADDRLQVGELFVIGRTLWQVTNRSIQQWRVSGANNPRSNQDITLKCIELLGGSNEIGLAGTDAVEKKEIGYNGERNLPWWVGPSFFPLLHVALGTVRNQRVVDATEIGIRSQVWNQAQGLCNFPEVPTPQRLKRFDDNNVQLTTGTQTKYFARTSFFTIMLRPVGLQANGQPYSWALLGEQFAVTGRAPVDQYNYIRLKSRTPGQFEYRFIPKVGADVRQFSPPDTKILLLNANGGQVIGENYQTEYGEFRVTVTGSWITPSEVTSNKEFRTRGVSATPGYFQGQPARLIFEGQFFPQNVSGGKFGGWHTDILGDALYYKRKYEERETTVEWAPGKTLTIRVRAKSIKRDNDLSGGWEWENPSEVTIVGWSHKPPRNHVFFANRKVDNKFWKSNLRGEVGPQFRVVYEDVYVPGLPENAERWFEEASQIADISHYEEVNKSNASNPEHSIVYVNESVTNPERPTYNNLTMLGVALRSSRAITSMDQMRAWLPNGVPAYRFDSDSTGPANKFSDLVYFLLTDTRMGAGTRVSADLIDTAGFYRTSRFLTENRIYFDGVIDERTNLRNYITALAPLHLCNFVIANGKFSVEPALPTNSNGTLNTSAVPIDALFTAGNIIEDSFAVQYLSDEERQDIRAVMTWREGAKNQLPESRSMQVAWADETANQAKTESFDLSAFCTYREQAFLTARYMMSIRRRITHTITFSTTPEGLYLKPGSYIRVMTKANPNISYANGSISSTGAVTSFGDPFDGVYSIYAYRAGDADIRETTLTVANGQTTDTTLFGALFSVKDEQTTCNIYQVDQLTMNEDGLVDVLASHFPCDAERRSLIVQDVLNENLFEVLD